MVFTVDSHKGEEGFPQDTIRGCSSGVERLLPKQNVTGSNPVTRSKPGEGQFYSDGTHTWKVERLIEAAANLRPFEVQVDSFKDVDFAVWEEAPTIRQAIEHFQRIQAADLTYPIIVSAQGWIMDGCHRLAKAIMEGRKTLWAVRFEKNPPADLVGED